MSSRFKVQLPSHGSSNVKSFTFGCDNENRKSILYNFILNCENANNINKIQYVKLYIGGQLFSSTTKFKNISEKSFNIRFFKNDIAIPVYKILYQDIKIYIESKIPISITLDVDLEKVGELELFYSKTKEGKNGKHFIPVEFEKKSSFLSRFYQKNAQKFLLITGNMIGFSNPY